MAGAASVMSAGALFVVAGLSLMKKREDSEEK